MALWLLRPTAQRDDPRWQGRTIWREALVRARSAAEARLLAAERDIDPSRPPTGNESPSFRSGFIDEKLYRVDRAGEEDGPPEVLRLTAEAPESPRQPPDS
jgi:hypothetical protein